MIKKGSILVATRSQFYGCGTTKVHMDAIVKAANYEDEKNKTIIVFLSKKREQRNEYLRIGTDGNKLRPATDKEIEMWEAGIRNCRGELV
jgi:hypothetical protein